MAEIFNRLLPVDLDGTIREPASGKKFIQHPLDQRIIAGVDKVIAHYHQEGYQIIGITNQGGVASGFKSFNECFEEQRYTLNLIPQMAQICFCPDFDGRECWVVNQVSPVPMPATSFGYEGADFRKPGPGMLKFTMWQHGVEPNDCFYKGLYSLTQNMTGGNGKDDGCIRSGILWKITVRNPTTGD